LPLGYSRIPSPFASWDKSILRDRRPAPQHDYGRRDDDGAKETAVGLFWAGWWIHANPDRSRPCRSPIRQERMQPAEPWKPGRGSPEKRSPL